MPKLVSIVLLLGVIVLLGLGWAARSETAYYLFYHLSFVYWSSNLSVGWLWLVECLVA